MPRKQQIQAARTLLAHATNNGRKFDLAAVQKLLLDRFNWPEADCLVVAQLVKGAR